MPSLRRRDPGSAPPLGRLRVAAVVDEFTRASLDPEVTLRSLDARTWRLELPVFRPDLLFVESTWRGKRDSWRRKVARYDNKQDDSLADLVAWCRKKNIPTVFWNKEDPVHFDRFIDAARLFDHVFTSDAGSVLAYERAGCRPGTVHPLMFAVQPAIYHPDDAIERDDRIVFAGSYGEPHFPERRAALELLLDAAAGLDLRIFDRNAGLPRSDKSFPNRFTPHLRGALDYPALAAEYRRAAVCLNVNSVTDSPTMFSRRVFEMLACGACVVSTPSAGIDAVFGDLVATVDTVGTARAAIRRLIDDDDHRAATSARGIREVMLHHTYEHRLREVTAALGLPIPTRTGIAALAVVHSPAEASRLVTLLETQTHGPTHVTVALRDMDDPALDHARTTLVSALSGHRTLTITDTRDFGTELMATRQLATDLRPTWVAPLHLARDYGPDHLADLAARTRYTPATIIHTPTGPGTLDSALIPTTLLATLGWSTAPHESQTLEAAYKLAETDR